MSKLNALGKGLGSLLPYPDEDNVGGEAQDRPYFLCPIDSISPNHFQPRKDIDNEALRQLSDSIKEKGILQPLVIRERSDGQGFELIAGERRWRAAKLAGLGEVPVLVKDVSKVDRLELALIENIQRQNLNPLEEAEAYQRLIQEFNLKQEEVAKRVGKERSTVANTLRIMQLPDYAKEDVAAGTLSMGHARVLLALDDPETMHACRDEIVDKGLSVRQAEALVKNLKKKTALPKPKKRVNLIPEAECQSLTNNLVRYLGTECKISQKGSRGKLVIEYGSADDLERLFGLIVKQ